VMERPEPAVGQVWKDDGGLLFVLFNGTHDKALSVVYEDFGAVWDLPIHRAIEATDTYVGPFDGFKVKEAT
jgi:hypothetical protein